MSSGVKKRAIAVRDELNRRRTLHPTGAAGQRDRWRRDDQARRVDISVATDRRCTAALPFFIDAGLAAAVALIICLAGVVSMSQPPVAHIRPSRRCR
jgi:hypothetical protein